MKPIKSLVDLRPRPAIKCFVCGAAKPDAGSQRFRAHKVCEQCVIKLQTKDRGARSGAQKGDES